VLSNDHSATAYDQYGHAAFQDSWNRISSSNKVALLRTFPEIYSSVTPRDGTAFFTTVASGPAKLQRKMLCLSGFSQLNAEGILDGESRRREHPPSASPRQAILLSSRLTAF
jgi:hypothetical protein